MTPNEYGKVLFDAYGKAAHYRDLGGNPLPKWEALPADVQGWFAAGAQAVLDAAQTTMTVPVMVDYEPLPFDDDIVFKLPDQRPEPSIG